MNDFKEILTAKRTKLSPSSINTYNSTLTNLHKHIFGNAELDVNNFDDVDKILDFLKIENSKNCVLALLEVRQRERLFIMSADVGSPVQQILKNDFQPEVIAGRYYSKLEEFKNLHRNSILQRVDSSMPVVNDVTRNRALYDRLLRTLAFINDEIIPNSIFDSLDTRAAFEREFNIGSISQKARDLYHIRTMIDILNLRNIPSKWFTMDLFINKNEEEEYDTLVRKFEKAAGISNNLIDGLRYGAYQMYEKDTKNTPSTCDCGHYMPDFHVWVAEKVCSEVKDILC